MESAYDFQIKTSQVTVFPSLKAHIILGSNQQGTEETSKWPLVYRVNSSFEQTLTALVNVYTFGEASQICINIIEMISKGNSHVFYIFCQLISDRNRVLTLLQLDGWKACSLNPVYKMEGTKIAVVLLHVAENGNTIASEISSLR